jgi:UDP-N-acetylmuramyl pentapeptide phosphotransferase/UDP-N-acetylglucosamine-1-phosphate transferase
MDGIDWMMVAEVVPVTVGIALIALMGELPQQVAVVVLALCGAIVGFAPFNRPVAKLFLGDVGSLPIGVLLAWALVTLAGQGHLVAALLLPLYFASDATITLARRLLAGEPVWQAHRGHFYQRATAVGFTVREVVARVFVVNAVLVALAIASVHFGSTAMQLATLTAGIVLVGGLLWSFARGKP